MYYERREWRIPSLAEDFPSRPRVTRHRLYRSLAASSWEPCFVLPCETKGNGSRLLCQTARYLFPSIGNRSNAPCGTWLLCLTAVLFLDRFIVVREYEIYRVLISTGHSSVKFKKRNLFIFLFFCIFLKDTVSKIHLTCELLELTKLWVFEGRECLVIGILNFKGIFLENDQLNQNFKYAFSTRVTIAIYQNQRKNFIFYIYLGLRSMRKTRENR